MDDELIPENQEPTPVSAPDPRQMALPFTTPEGQAPQVCASPGCGRQLDPVNFKIDADTNEPLCDEHAVQCYSCHQWHSLEHLTPNSLHLSRTKRSGLVLCNLLWQQLYHLPKLRRDCP